MKNYINIKRLFEQEAVSAADFEELGMQPEAPEMPETPEMEAPAPALPAEGESSAANDPMTMTVRDFIAKCKEVDPLVCMGIESFIEKNQGAFGAPAMPQMEPTQDLNFSNAVAPQQDELSFSGAVPPQGGAMPAPAPSAPQPASTFPAY
jgi:hypothetical protein